MNLTNEIKIKSIHLRGIWNLKTINDELKIQRIYDYKLL